MSTILTTLTLLIGLGIAIETTTLSTETNSTTEVCIDPTGSLPPPPVQ